METKNSTGQNFTDRQRSEEELRRAELEKKIRRRVALEEKAHRIVERLIEKAVAKDFFCSAGKFITPAHYEDIVEERAIEKYCGYPVCDNALTKVLKQKYKISTKTNRVYDISERKNFCSERCYKASKFYVKQVPSNPVWLRETQEMQDLVLLEGEKKNFEITGEIVVGTGAKSEIGDLAEVDALGSKRHGQSYSQNIEKISKGVDHMTLEDFTTSQNVKKSMEQYQVLEKRTDNEDKGTNAMEKSNTKGKTSSGNHCDIIEERIKTKKEMLAPVPVPDIIAVGLNGKETILNVQSNAEGTKREESSQHLVKEFQGGEKRQNDQKVKDGTVQTSSDIEQINAKANLLMQMLDRREQLISEMKKVKVSNETKNKGSDDKSYGQSCNLVREGVCNEAREVVIEKNEKDKVEVMQDKDVKIIDHPEMKEKINTLEVKGQNTQKLTDQNCEKNLTEELIKPQDLSQNDTQDQPGGTHNTEKQKEKQDTKSAVNVKNPAIVRTQAPFEFIAGVLLDWRTPKSVQYLTGDKSETAEEKLSKSPTTEEVSEPEEGEGRKIMAKETAEMSAKVFQHYGWKKDESSVLTEKAVAEKTNENQAREPNLPVVDSCSQMSYRRKIVLDKVSKVLPNVLGPLKLSPRSVSSELRQLVHTFNLTSTNIVLKPAEWTLMTVLLTYILSVKIEAVQEALSQESSKHYMNTIMESIGITETDIHKFVKNFLHKR